MCAVHHNVLFNFVNTSEVFLVVVFFFKTFFLTLSLIKLKFVIFLNLSKL